MSNESDPLKGADPAVATPAEEPYPPIGYAWYVVFILMIAYVFSFIDRQILALLVQPIRRDLDISDTQMSLLMGFSFALFYTFFGFPMGRLADSRSRRGLIAAGLVVWSVMTALCGVVRTYWELLFFRMGVGVGEAALSPAAYSLITDYFPKHRLGLAMSVYGMGIYIGSGMAFLLGGIVVGFVMGAEEWTIPVISSFIGTVRPWQTVFFIVGIPGVLFALAMFTVKEPVRRGIKRVTDASGARVTHVPLREVLAYLRGNWATFGFHCTAMALLAFAAYGSTAWVVEFFVRTYEMPAATAGKWYGVIVMVFGSMGILAGGFLADWLLSKGYTDAKVLTPLIAAVLNLPFAILFPLAPSAFWAMALLVPAVFATAMPFGAGAAAIQEIMPNRMRGQASAIYLFIVNLIGLGLGPSAVAVCTDYVFHDDAMLRYSLAIVGSGACIAATVLFIAALKHYRASLDYLKHWQADQR